MSQGPREIQEKYGKEEQVVALESFWWTVSLLGDAALLFRENSVSTI